ncbi:hypothetical protein [Beijerinckia sp. L45]|uniref:hypothetical protein n=1 Tax=Beijerinckia sp. L45 TaxID=1641855 RepID=UPI00131E03EF|nr:hypothetical protein [Beijerinckia sp. L45]
MGANALSVDTADFSARSAELLGQIRSRTIDQLLITEHGRVVAVMTVPEQSDRTFNLHKILRGTITAPPASIRPRRLTSL